VHLSDDDQGINGWFVTNQFPVYRHPGSCVSRATQNSILFMADCFVPCLFLGVGAKESYAMVPAPRTQESGRNDVEDYNNNNHHQDRGFVRSGIWWQLIELNDSKRQFPSITRWLTGWLSWRQSVTSTVFWRSLNQDAVFAEDRWQQQQDMK
jgi:hypothetical protein